MVWQARYLPPDPVLWQGRADMPNDACFYQHVELLNLLTTSAQKTAPTAFALLGFRCDEGVQRDLGRSGAAEGSTAIRQYLGRLPIQNAAIQVFDAGNITCIDHDLEASQIALAEIVKLLLAAEIHPIILGGGHELAFGHFQGIAQFVQKKSLGIINFDAHFDLQPLEHGEPGSAATTFYQIAKYQETGTLVDLNCIGIQHSGNIRELFEQAKRLGVKTIFADDLHQRQIEKCVDFVDRVLDQNEGLYMSISLDVFSPAYAPGVSMSQPLGLQPWDIIPYIRQAAASGKMLSYDIVEHVPRYDIDHRTAKLAAALVYEIVHHHRDF